MLLANTRFTANPSRPSGAPSAVRGTESAAKARAETLGKTKGNEGSLVVRYGI